MSTFLEKTRMKTSSLWFAIALASASGVQAQTQASSVGVNLKAGTAGAGFDLIVPMGNSLNLRLGHANFEASKAVTKEEVDYTAQLVLGGTNALVDWFPSKTSSFRWTLGAYAPKHHLTGQAKASEGRTITINQVDYSARALGQLDLSVQWGGTRPYLGLGFDGFRAARAGVYFNVDAGVIFSGAPTVRLTASCVHALLCEAIEDDRQAEETKIRNQVASQKFLPVVQIGVGYRF